MKELPNLFANNRHWALGIKAQNPGFFEKLSHQQSPQYLWIGCSDSRVPANEIIGLLPGEVFVHRNVANVVVHSDLNCLSCLQYAIDVLKVRHIIVCGHYGCGGVQAALSGRKMGLIDNWLRHVQDVGHQHKPALDRSPDDKARGDRLCELNVIEQVLNVSRTTVVQDAWARQQPVSLHGWIYSLDDGFLRDLGMCCRHEAEVLENYRQAIALRSV
ncbi:MAG: carbonate dehydratase [Candidatus Methylacidiphilales bacterium]|nr:carbonate dehydratase [Candidatus Methylacidiphilales bacterium]